MAFEVVQDSRVGVDVKTGKSLNHIAHRSYYLGGKRFILNNEVLFFVFFFFLIVNVGSCL